MYYIQLQCNTYKIYYNILQIVFQRDTKKRHHLVSFFYLNFLYFFTRIFESMCLDYFPILA